jgi:hypothetical protein
MSRENGAKKQISWYNGPKNSEQNIRLAELAQKNGVSWTINWRAVKKTNNPLTGTRQKTAPNKIVCSINMALNYETWREVRRRSVLWNWSFSTFGQKVTFLSITWDTSFCVVVTKSERKPLVHRERMHDLIQPRQNLRITATIKKKIIVITILIAIWKYYLYNHVLRPISLQNYNL